MVPARQPVAKLTDRPPDAPGSSRPRSPPWARTARGPSRCRYLRGGDSKRRDPGPAAVHTARGTAGPGPAPPPRRVPLPNGSVPRRARPRSFPEGQNPNNDRGPKAPPRERTAPAELPRRPGSTLRPGPGPGKGRFGHRRGWGAASAPAPLLRRPRARWPPRRARAGRSGPVRPRRLPVPVPHGSLPPRGRGGGLATPALGKGRPPHACPRRGLHGDRPAPFLPGTYRVVARLCPSPRRLRALAPASAHLVPPSSPRLHPRVNQIPSLQQPCWAPVRARRSPQEPPAASAGGSAAGLGSGAPAPTGEPEPGQPGKPAAPVSHRTEGCRRVPLPVTSHRYR